MEIKGSNLYLSIKNSYINGITDVIIKTLTSGSLLTVFAVSIGISNVQLGFLLSILPFSSLVHILVASAIEKGKSPRKIAWISSLLARPFLLVMALTIFITNKELSMYVFLVSYALSYFLASVTGGTFWPWCKILIPHKITTSFLAHRTQLIIMSKIITFIAASLILYFVQKYNPSLEIYCYSFFFFAAFIAGIVCTISLYKISDIKVSSTINQLILKKFKNALTNKSFVMFLAETGLINFMFTLYTSFYVVYFLESIKLSAYVVILYTMLSDLASIPALKWWCSITNKNPTSMLSYSVIFLFLSGLIFFAYSLQLGNNIPTYILVVTSILIGIGTAAYTLGINSSIFEYTPKEMSSIYVSLANMWRFASCGLGTVFGGVFLGYISRYSIKWPLFFGLVIILCILTFFAAKKVKSVKNA